uniref:AHA10 n=1 Tax=Arundo donax TaxID=35708 RepID=A0A0A8ZBA2_ARUDO
MPTFCRKKKTRASAMMPRSTKQKQKEPAAMTPFLSCPGREKRFGYSFRVLPGMSLPVAVTTAVPSPQDTAQP